MRKQMKEQKNLRSKRGITLIALVVTIVVLLILAGITISTLFGDNGIISAARKAADETKKSEEDTENNIGNIVDQMNFALTGKLEKGKILNKSNRYAIYIDEDGKTAPIPGGYCVVNNYTRNGVEDINKIDNGLVISDIAEDDLDNTKHGNQFVWVPVSDEQLSTMYGTDSNGKKWGKLYEFGSRSWNGSSYTWTTYTHPQALQWTETNGIMKTPRSNYGDGEYREPDVSPSYDNNTYYDFYDKNLSILGLNSIDDLNVELQTSFNNMIESIKKYKGFYIGRYETGNLEENKYNIPVVQKGNNKISNVNWYYQYETTKNISKENNNVTSNMIWGCQFDRTLDWIANTNEGGYSLLTSNSATWGNYKNSTGDASNNSGIKQPSGTNYAWQKNHIYDLAGNVEEWTIEIGHCRRKN